MTTDATQVRVGSNGEVFVAPVGTPLPVDATVALNAAFVGLGFLTDEGATFRIGADIVDVNAWQSFYPVRKIVQSRTFQVSGTFLEWDPDVLSFATGGGTFSDLGTNEASYSPPDPSVLDERALVLQYLDGTNQHRIVVPRGLITGELEVNISRTGAAVLPFQFDATPTGVDDPWTMLFADESFETVS